MLKLKLQYFGHLIRRANSFEKILLLGKIGGRTRRGQQMLRRLDDITDLMDLSLSKLWETVKDRKVWPAAVHGVTKSQTWLSDRTATAIWWYFVYEISLPVVSVSQPTLSSASQSWKFPFILWIKAQRHCWNIPPSLEIKNPGSCSLVDLLKASAIF